MAGEWEVREVNSIVDVYPILKVCCVYYLEDIDYIRRLIKKHKYRMLESTEILASPRRFKTDGMVMPYLKILEYKYF